MEPKNPFPEVTEMVVDLGADTLSSCMQCGLCTAGCPWRLVEGEISDHFNNRKVQHMGQLGVDGYEDEDILYACTTCGVCTTRCPREVNGIENMRILRTLIAETSGLPKSVNPAAGSMTDNGNPWQGERKDRMAWTKGLDVPTFDGSQEYFLFVCCTSCYDKRSMKIARSIARTLNEAGVSYGVIGEEESCCGESIRKVGGEEVFQESAARNIELFNGKGVKKIITTSPHCLWTFRNEYPELGGNYDVIHYSELFTDLIKEGKLELKNDLGKKVVFHDPCYLGRHSKVYDAPRNIIEALPATETEDMMRSRTDSLCCGGGGGRVWMETEVGARFGDLRIYEALEKDAEILATSCPYCVIMLEASNMALEKDDKLEIKDLSELVCAASVGDE